MRQADSRARAILTGGRSHSPSPQSRVSASRRRYTQCRSPTATRVSVQMLVRATIPRVLTGSDLTSSSGDHELVDTIYSGAYYGVII
jgi:hypothetical protein